jgi:hypothetical protein
MTTSEHTVDDIAEGTGYDGGHQVDGERQALELADRIRLVAAEDPELAQDLVDQLIVALDKAMGGTFREHLDGDALGVADRALVKTGNAYGPGDSSSLNS